MEPVSAKSRDFVRQLPDSSQHFKKPLGLWHRLHIDPWLLLGLLMLTAAGLLILYSASGQNLAMVKRQAVFFVMAYLAMLVAAQARLRFLRRWSYWFYALAVLLLVLVLLIGVGAKGAQRWLSLGVIRFQPSEIMKLALPLCVASYFSTKVLPPRLLHVIVCLALVAVPVVLILKQPDLGTALMVCVSGLVGLFLAGLPWRHVGFALLLAVAASYPMWHFVMHDYQKQRVLTLLNPEVDQLGVGWNTIQAKTAIGSGGISGKGWLKGTQSQLDFLPESHTDFIIAVVAEEFGITGFLLLLGLYLAVILRGLWIALKARNNFSRILAGSITLTFMVYVFVNIGMVSGILPIVGVPLPLVSLGGTSLISLMLGFGLLMAVATEPQKSPFTNG